MSDAATAAVPWTPTLDGVRVRVRLTPRGGRDAVDGMATLSDETPVLLARVRTAPEKGAANAALEKLLADAAGVPASSVSVIAGGTARVKTVAISGAPAALAAALAAAARPSRKGRP
jgi:uncharacterized protein YggU (UPF0235/DUF167 family)